MGRTYKDRKNYSRDTFKPKNIRKSIRMGWDKSRKRTDVEDYNFEEDINIEDLVTLPDEEK